MSDYTIPVRDSVVIDTNPMANSIDRVSHHVDGVTTAVVAMQASVVIAEEDAAEHICKNVNKGFYSLIRSQISQKLAKLRSQADSKFIELQQQSKSLLSYKTRMEKDYMMISARYTKLFNSLNKALKIRIFELDKPTTTFVNKDIESIANRVKMLTATTPISQIESLGKSQFIAASNTKYNALNCIEGMQQFISNSNHQKYLVSRVLESKSLTNKTKLMIPIAITEAEGISIKQKQWNYYMPESEKRTLASKINLNVQSYIFSSIQDLKWTAGSAEEKGKISMEFNRIIDKVNISDRIKKQINQLYNAQIGQILQKISK